MPRTDGIKCVFVSDYWNDCIDDIIFLCYLLEKRYAVFITSWHCSLGGNFLADTIRYLSCPALSRSWHLAASGMGLRVMSHQAGLLTTLHHIHICFPEQGGNMVTTMGWGFSDFRQLFCFPLLINKACMYHNHIPLMYIFDSPSSMNIIPSTTSSAIKSPCFKVKPISYEMKKKYWYHFPRNVFENDGCRAKCMFVLPTMCEMGLLLWIS